MPIRVDSEIGRLRRVLVHRPGREIDWMVPTMMGQLLFDDILDGEVARAEHDDFRTLLEKSGAETLQAETLLADVLADPEVRAEVRDLFEEKFGAPSRLWWELEEQSPEEIAAALIGGCRATGGASRSPFALDPLPNYFFQRDPAVVIGDRVVISSMASSAREREPTLTRLLFAYHPALADHSGRFDIQPRDGAEGPFPFLEGGDVLVASPEVLLVGVSERTNRRGVERLAEHLRRQKTGLRSLLLVELPHRRSYMHLDTVFTFIDHHQCLSHEPVISSEGPGSAGVYRVDLTSDVLAFTVRPSLRKALAELGLDLEMVPCGGSEDEVFQEREQWTDGANAFAVAPGVIFLYRRNRRTLDELDRRGWRILREEAIVAGEEEILGHGPTVVTILGNELSRARGGPRCMTMPLEREPL